MSKSKGRPSTMARSAAAAFLLLLSLVVHGCEAHFSIEKVQEPKSADDDSEMPWAMNANLLQLCIDKCQDEGHCCGNRLTGEVTGSAYARLSCANGCEIAFYSETEKDCKDSCTEGNELNECEYKHPILPYTFRMCSECQEGCDDPVEENECRKGCNLASEIEYFYKPGSSCEDDPNWGLNGDAEKTCQSWIGENPAVAYKRCGTVENQNPLHAGKTVAEICPVSCRCAADTCAYCGPKCKDDDSFRYQDDPKKSCRKWVKKKKNKRCKLEGVSEACPRICKSMRRINAYPRKRESILIEMCVRGSDKKSRWQTIGETKERRMGVNLGYVPASLTTAGGDETYGGTYGFSYYIRAYDLIRDTPVEELGWGQWTSGNGDDLSVCGRHPHSFVCNEEPPSDEDMLGDLKNCGSQDLEVLEQCQYECCGEDYKCWLGGGSNIEGGMGYWMYTLETPHVKWMGPAAVNHWYRSISGTFMPTRPNPCTKLGGAVRVANSMVLPNDQVQFQVPNDGSVNGFLGYMVSRTPIGKRHKKDRANHWTIFLDAENYSGPVYYISSWFWDSISAWHPESVTWAEPDRLIDYAEQGVEGNVGGFKFTDEYGSIWVRTNKVAFPRDKIDGVFVNYVTLSTAHSKYETDWAEDAMEPLLSGTGSSSEQSINHILASSQRMRFEPNQCYFQHLHDQGSGAWTLSIDENHFVGFGVGDELPTDDDQERQESEAAHCFQRIKIDPTKLDCDEKTGFCQTHEYIRLDKDDPSVGIPVESSKVPKHVRDALSTEEFLPTRFNDGRYYGPPAETERPCFEQPGPADPKLYCTRLQSGTWVGFRWYRFVDQPELNQVFASIENRAQRDKAKCYMQERIERLHEAVNNGGELPRWFMPPQGDDQMPANLVSIDPGYLVTPPDGLEKGFVPVPMWERNRQPSPDCDVFLGEHSREPDPFPDDYYDGFVNDDGEHLNQECPANLESPQEPLTFPGTVYPYPFKDDEGRKPYDVPLKEDVASVLDEIPVNCGT